MEELQKRNRKLYRRGILAVGLTCLMGWTFAYLATNVFRDYALGLFVWLPFVMGATSTLLYGYHNTSERYRLFNISMLTLIVFCLGLLFFAWEGLICLVMALPIGIFFTWLGHLTGYLIIKRKVGHSPMVIIFLFISVPCLTGFETAIHHNTSIRSVTTSVEINATRELVWKNVIAFPQLESPTEFIFKTGIAFPISATISGYGIGAVRLCNFSTGSFTEPITTWEEPRLLKFSVAEQPETMKELSFYDIHPNHLQGYWVSKQGQFKLTALPNGHTLLEGTTWYENKIRPDFYWTIWSDYVVHKIHKRVLQHIKSLSER